VHSVGRKCRSRLPLRYGAGTTVGRKIGEVASKMGVYWASPANSPAEAQNTPIASVRRNANALSAWSALAPDPRSDLGQVFTGRIRFYRIIGTFMCAEGEL
jgi:hypothetical protein